MATHVKAAQITGGVQRRDLELLNPSMLSFSPNSSWEGAVRGSGCRIQSPVVCVPALRLGTLVTGTLCSTLEFAHSEHAGWKNAAFVISRILASESPAT